MSAAEQQARILQYWRAVELFSPQKVPRLNPNSQTEPVLRSGGGTPLPWHPSNWFPPAPHGFTWRFTAYCGLYRLGRLRARLEHHFHPGHSVNFDQQRDTESCLAAFQITAEGRPLLDTFVLASAPWAVGRLEKLNPQNPAWLQGFEASASEQALRLAERFAIRENDEAGRLLLQQGFHVGRPVQPGDLETDGAQIAHSLGVAQALRPTGFRLAARQIPEKYALEADSDDFLNSFFLRDLERVADAAARSQVSAPLSRFLSPDSSLSTDDRHDFSRHDVRTAPDLLWQNTAPQLVPAARWPASPRQSLYFSQQFAINSALESFDSATNSLFAINGPPGTGKTTLLRDVIAAVLVRRAQALAQLARPHLAFEETPVHWNTADRRRPVHLWRPAFLGFEIVVASSNNRAVENVTLEIPAKRAVDQGCLPDIDYFADFATRLLADKKDQAGEPIEAWGLVAARLGNRKNRRDFMKRFWGADKQAPEPRDRAHDGFYRYLKSLQPSPRHLLAWKNAVSSFRHALQAEAVIRQQRRAAWQAVSLKADLSKARTQLANCRADLDAALAARHNHQPFKPGLVDALFTRGSAYQEWRETDQRLASAIAASQTACDQARAAVASLAATEEHLVPLAAAFPAPSPEQWLADPEARELSSPWADESWNRARNRVFVEALHLHRTFIECVPRQMRQNLDAAMDVLGGKVSPCGPSLQSAWATLFFVVPVVSTTFASFDRLFSNLDAESLGWLLIDEAGQALPQAVAGALWRARRAIVVGDPRQLEPIVSLPYSAQQALRRHFEIDETWLPSHNSAQKLADRVSPLGTWIENADEEKPIWVGSPLRVHRRCEQPMFGISNLIAYDGQMVFATEQLPSSLPPSSWIDIAASESDDHWIPAEGVVLEILLSELRRASVKPSDVLLISPFRAVARKLSAIASRHGIRLRGTIHVSQGKEAAVVILVLGGDPRRARAKDWASEKPNLLNVAVSRAQRRLYIIGNREEWSQYPNFAEAALLLGKENSRKTLAAAKR